jgi:hypothetical protein
MATQLQGQQGHTGNSHGLSDRDSAMAEGVVMSDIHELQEEIVLKSLNKYRETLAEKYAENNALMTRLLYGDLENQTYWQLFKTRINSYRKRIGDAWLVLSGQAFIGYD